MICVPSASASGGFTLTNVLAFWPPSLRRMARTSAHLAAIITLDLNTGLRRTELLSLKVAEVDFQHNTIGATETKNGEDRKVVMNATTRALLLELADTARAMVHRFNRIKAARPIELIACVECGTRS